MGFFDFLRRDQKAMPEPGSPEFDQAVQGSALPGSANMGEEGWTSAIQQPAGAGPAAPVPHAGMPMTDQLIAAGVPADQAQQTAAALAQLQQAFGASFGGVPSSADVSVSAGPSQTLDLRGMEGLREEMMATMRQYGVDPESGQAFDATQVPGLQEALLAVLAKHGVNAGGL